MFVSCIPLDSIFLVLSEERQTENGDFAFLSGLRDKKTLRQADKKSGFFRRNPWLSLHVKDILIQRTDGIGRRNPHHGASRCNLFCLRPIHVIVSVEHFAKMTHVLRMTVKDH
jgi:hypothetical protein